MVVFQLDVKDQKLSISKYVKQIITTNSINFFECIINFDGIWDTYSDTLTKTILFYQSPQHKYEVLVENNKCTIPGEVLLNHALPLYVGLIGIQADPYLVVTTNIIELPLVQGMSRDHSQTPAITPTIYDQLLQAFTEMYNDTIAAVANKQDKTDNNLETEEKTVVGAINEVNTELGTKANTTYVDNADTNLQKQIDAVVYSSATIMAQLENHIIDKNNPHIVTKTQIGLGNVDNTSDLDKPISYATRTALNSKVNQVTAQWLHDNEDSLQYVDPVEIFQCTTTGYNYRQGYCYVKKLDQTTWEPYWERTDVQPQTDLTNYYTKTETNLYFYTKPDTDDLLDTKQDKTDNNLQTTSKSVIGAINELKSNVSTITDDIRDLFTQKQDKFDPFLQTTSKTVVGAINELNTDKADTTYVDNADNNLQEQIDAIASSSDVVDVVGTYAELQAYDTSHLKDNDIVKVLEDNTHNNAITYYRWIINQQTHTGSWSYIGQSGPYYTKSETDSLLQGKADANNVYTKTQMDDLLEAKATKTQLENHILDTNNPHNVTKAQVGLGNVNNTSDLDKPISTATQAALNIMNSAIDTKQQKFANTEETGAGDYILTPLKNTSEVILSGRFRFYPDPDADENSADIVNRAILENAILPLATYDDVNRALATKQDVFYKTSLDSVLVQNTMYDLGSLEQSSVTLTLPTSGNSSCREIYVAFKSGSTATALNIINSYVGDTSYVPSPDSICELSFKYICGAWVLVAKDTPLSNI